MKSSRLMKRKMDAEVRSKTKNNTRGIKSIRGKDGLMYEVNVTEPLHRDEKGNWKGKSGKAKIKNGRVYSI